MKQITAYKLSNGVIVENEQEAILRQNEIHFEKSITDMVNNDVAYNSYQKSVISFITENVVELKKVFDKYRIR